MSNLWSTFEQRYLVKSNGNLTFLGHTFLALFFASAIMAIIMLVIAFATLSITGVYNWAMVRAVFAMLYILFVLISYGIE